MRTYIFFVCLITIFSLGFGSSPSASDKKIVQGKGCYHYGDKETPIFAKDMALTLAKRNAIENYRTFIASQIEVENSTLTRRIITSLSEGYLHDLIIVKEEEQGRRFCIWITANVIPADIDEFIEKATYSHIERTKDVTLDWKGKIIKVKGFGGANKSFPRHVWKKSAEEAAIVDAQAKLIEFIDGFALESKTFVKNHQLSRDEKIKEIRGQLKNVKKVGITTYPTDDTAEVMMEMSLQEILD